MATEVDIVNMALMRLGISDLVTSSDGTLANATSTGEITTQASFFYPLKRDELLESWYWRFARKYELLVVDDEGDDEPWENEWDRSFTLPADCLRARRFVSGNGAPYATWQRYPDDVDRLNYYEYKFVIRVHDDVKVVMTNAPTPANLEYTEAITDATRFPPSFASLLGWLVASELAGPLASDAALAAQTMTMYRLMTPHAQNIDANEEQAPDSPDDVFIASRGS